MLCRIVKSQDKILSAVQLAESDYQIGESRDWQADSRPHYHGVGSRSVRNEKEEISVKLSRLRKRGNAGTSEVAKTPPDPWQN